MESYNAHFAGQMIFLIVFFGSLLAMIHFSNKEKISNTDIFIFLLVVAIFIMNIVCICV